jgi:hypothetical protein
MQSWRALRAARHTLSEISAQDEFAKWARQQRTVDKLQGEFDRISKKRRMIVLIDRWGETEESNGETVWVGLGSKSIVLCNGGMVDEM